MILGAFISAGLDLTEFRDKLNSLPITGYEIQVKEVVKKGISAKYVNVEVVEEQAHRYLKDIDEIISQSEFSAEVKDLALKIFNRLAEAEARVHDTSKDQVQFHEVGAVDAIIDILGAAYGFINLEIDKLYFSPLNVGGGMVKCAHGLMPVPAPATAELLINTISYGGEIKKELVTPTGAAIITTIGENVQNQPMMKINNIFHSAGTWDLEIPNVLRLVLGEEVEKGAKDIRDDIQYNRQNENQTKHQAADQDQAWDQDNKQAVNQADDQVLVLETNIDDMSPEIYGYLMEHLYDQGALELYLTPVQMKKNRPGVLLSVICTRKEKQQLIDIILRETTTLGVRTRTEERYTLSRKQEVVNTDYGEVRVKISLLGNEVITIKPEYEDCKLIAQREGLPLKMIWQDAFELANKLKLTKSNLNKLK